MSFILPGLKIGSQDTTFQAKPLFTTPSLLYVNGSEANWQ